MSHIFGNIGVTAITDVIDANKSLGFDLSGAAADTSVTLNLAQTANRNWTVPDASSTFTGTDLVQTITNKTIYEPTANTVTAAGTTQGTATALSNMYNVVTTVPASSGVRLPNPASTGLKISVHNRGTNALNVYPASGATIDSASVNTAIALPSNSSITFESTSTTSWLTTVPPVIADSGMAVNYQNGRTTVATALLPSNLPANVVTDTLTGNQNNYNPAGLSTAIQLRLTASGADRTITGLQFFGTMGSPGLSELKITNVGASNNLILSHLSGSSNAANQFSFDTNDVVLTPGQNLTIFYDYTSSKWRAVAISQDGNFGGKFTTSGVLTPPTITATPVNNYNPTGLANAAILRISANLVASITGISGGVDGRRLQLINTGTVPISIANQSALSTTANRIFIGTSNATLVGGAVMTLVYDNTVMQWRVAGGSGGATSGAGGLVQSQWTEVNVDRSTTNTTWDLSYCNITVSGTLPQATITVDRTGNLNATNSVLGSPAFPSSGIISVLTTSNGTQIVSYTGITATSFTGCTGGTGAFGAGAQIWSGPRRTTIAAGSNGASLPVTTLNVASTSGFPTSGTLSVTSSLNTQKVTYTGITATSFTGCAGGTGVLSTGGIVTNVSITSQDLIYTDITTSGGAIIINSSASASTDSNKTGFFQIVVDGFFQRGGSTQGNGGAPAGSAVIGLKLGNVPAGYHFVTLKWVVSGGTLAIFPITMSIDNNANMLVQEVTS